MFSTTTRLSLFLLSSTALAIGLLRFSYTALLPSTRLAFEWSHHFASLLGSANLLGYLLGAYWAIQISPNQGMIRYLQGAAGIGSLSLLCCAFGFFNEAWYIFWRILSGVSGGLIMILAPSVVAHCCAPQHRLRINFIGFSGVGLGVLIATLFLPYLDHLHPTIAWLILFGCAVLLSLFLSLLLIPFKPTLNIFSSTSQIPITTDGIYRSLIIVYSCSAFAYIPHSLFWIDYLSQSLKIPFSVINFNWMLYGLGSALGAITAYLCTQKLGNLTALKVLYISYVAAILCALFDHPFLILLSSFSTGLLNPAVVFLTSYTILQRYGMAYKKLWGIATMSFAATQLFGGLCFSILQQFHMSYQHQFILAGGVLCVGTITFIFYEKTHVFIKKKLKHIFNHRFR